MNEIHSRSDGKAPVKMKHALGCLLALVVIPLLGVSGIFYLGGLHQEEWAAARPAGITDKEWDSHRASCETASLSTTKCGATSNVEVKRLASEAMQKFCAEDARSEAITKAKDAVLAHLKAPSSADFVGSSIGAIHHGCDWTVSGQVDSQNSFGAMMRAPFKVHIRRVGKNVWIPWSVRVD